MSSAGERRRGLSESEQTPSECVRALDIAEREAIEAGDWAQLGHILAEQRSLWGELVCMVKTNGPGAGAAAAAIAQLHEVRRRNHGVIEQQSIECRSRLSEVSQTREALAAYSEVINRVA